MSKADFNQKSMEHSPNLVCLLEPFYEQYYTPMFWQEGAKSRNYFAQISKGLKYPFQRQFLNSYLIDNKVTYKISDFPEGEIIEQKSVYIKGTKQEVTFQGFFIIQHTDEGIMGEEISQKETLRYFDYREKLPSLDQTDERLNILKVKLGTVIRKFTRKYGQEAIVQILTDILSDYFPD